MRNGQAYQRKTEKFFVYEEKKFGRIDSRTSFFVTVGRFLQSDKPPESILPNFHFSGFPIFAVKLECL